MDTSGPRGAGVSPEILASLAWALSILLERIEISSGEVGGRPGLLASLHKRLARDRSVAWTRPLGPALKSPDVLC